MTDKPDPKDEGLVNVFDDFLLKERLALKLPCGKDEPRRSLRFRAGDFRWRHTVGILRAGVIQTFLNEKPGNAAPESSDTCFDRFDYMSTVSGGGYIGGAVSWLKHHFDKGGNWRTYLGAAISVLAAPSSRPTVS
jgi:hypothetical protein